MLTRDLFARANLLVNFNTPLVMRGYTWLYAAYVPKRRDNHIVTINVVYPSSWRQQLVENPNFSTPFGMDEAAHFKL